MSPPTVPRNYPVSSFKMAAEWGEWWWLCEGSAGGATVSQMKWLIRMEEEEEEEEVHLNSSCFSNIPRIALSIAIKT